MQRPVWVFALVIVCLCLTTPATASFLADGKLGDWGVSLTDNHGDLAPSAGGNLLNHWGDVTAWQPSSSVDVAAYTQGFGTEDDMTASGTSSGGEWYDIEALYVDYHWSADDHYVTGIDWAIVTSWNGDDLGSWGNRWYNTWQDGARYHLQPYVALDLGLDGVDPEGTTGWDLGLVLADEEEITDSGNLSTYLNYNGSMKDKYFGNRFTAKLWNTQGVDWRSGGPGGTGGAPVDFLFTDAMLANGPIATAAGQYYGYAKKADGSTYSEPGNEGDPMDYYQIQTWDKNNKWRNLNWCWEGSMALSEYIPVQPGAELTASYAMWCFNDNTGDMISFEPNGNGPPVPEPASVGLLGLAVAGIAAGFRRRRSK